jgi:hypothetical protein
VRGAADLMVLRNASGAVAVFFETQRKVGV